MSHIHDRTTNSLISTEVEGPETSAATTQLKQSIAPLSVPIQMQRIKPPTPFGYQPIQAKAVGGASGAKDSGEKGSDKGGDKANGMTAGGLPLQLQAGIQNLAGMDISDVRVHYNSDKPLQLEAHAYTQGSDIYLGPGQEKHLPHEAWHVVQQKQGRVKATKQIQSMQPINDDEGLEREADVMGAKAAQANKSDA